MRAAGPERPAALFDSARVTITLASGGIAVAAGGIPGVDLRGGPTQRNRTATRLLRVASLMSSRRAFLVGRLPVLVGGVAPLASRRAHSSTLAESCGIDVIPDGAVTVTIDAPVDPDGSLILLTLMSDPEGQMPFVRIDPGAFSVSVQDDAHGDILFAWLAVERGPTPE